MLAFSLQPCYDRQAGSGMLSGSHRRYFDPMCGLFPEKGAYPAGYAFFRPAL
jgi:hypothetical protein